MCCFISRSRVPIISRVKYSYVTMCAHVYAKCKYMINTHTHTTYIHTCIKLWKFARASFVSLRTKGRSRNKRVRARSVWVSFSSKRRMSQLLTTYPGLRFPLAPARSPYFVPVGSQQIHFVRRSTLRCFRAQANYALYPLHN